MAVDPQSSQNKDAGPQSSRNKDAGPPQAAPDKLVAREAAKEAKRAAKAAAAAKKAAKDTAAAKGGGQGAAQGEAQGAPQAATQGAPPKASAPPTSATAPTSPNPPPVPTQPPPPAHAAQGPPKKPTPQQKQQPRGAASKNAPPPSHDSSGSANSRAPGAAAAASPAQAAPPVYVPNVLGSISLFGNVAYPKVDAATHLYAGLAKGNIHPSVLSLAVQLSTFAIAGSSARSIAILSALSDYVADYRTPSGAVLSRDLITKLSAQISHITAARPLGNAAGNAVRFLKFEISNIPVDWSEERAKSHLVSRISHFVHDRIVDASRCISQDVLAHRIRDGDVVLTYGRSSVVEATLLYAWRELGKRFEVVVVDSRPLWEGKRLLASLVSHRIPCTYGLLTSLAELVPRANLALLGTSSMLANGAAYARSGTASVAALASKRGVPVVVASETFKFSERMQLDALHNNEAADPTALFAASPSSASVPPQLLLTTAEWREEELLSAVNLLYDLTPPRHITAVASEVGLSHPSSIGVLVRDFKSLVVDG